VSEYLDLVAFSVILWLIVGSLTFSRSCSIYYGPDSVHSEFEADSCSVAFGLPTCAQWKPDSLAFLKLLTNQAPPVVGGMCLVGILAATMSTADGAILALGTVMSNNLFRHLGRWLPSKAVTNENLLLVARISTLPLTIASTSIAAYYRKTDEAHAAGATGYLLIVAFDIVFATVVVPLFGAFYTKKPSPRAALLSIIAGATTRIVMEFALPKDGNLLLPYDDPEFLDYGPAASTLPPAFIDTNSTDGTWAPDVDICYQETYRDFTGVDSLTAAIVSLLVFTSVQYLEHFKGEALFQFTGGTGYDKSKDGSDKEKLDDWTTPVEVLFAAMVRDTSCVTRGWWTDSRYRMVCSH
jgi:Na+/proline symporter